MKKKTKYITQEEFDKLTLIVKDNSEMVDKLVAAIAKIIRTNHNLIEVIKASNIDKNKILTDNTKITIGDILESKYAIPTMLSNAEIVQKTIESLCEALTR